MTIFYFKVEMTKPSGHYWTIGLKLEAESYTEALRIFKAWSHGVEAMSSLMPYLRNLGNSPTPDRSYFNLDSIDTIQKELAIFMHEDHTTDEGKELLDELVEAQQRDLDEDTYEPDPDMVAADLDKEPPF